ncbi:MAG TPA: hypothetical protein VKY27_02960 [Bacteriovoracaceae bacterium]|nr:hypothetical protein [Bacteriovoracaceae bacterium]
MKVGVIALSVILLYGCSSSSKREVKDVDNSRTIKKDYEVKDASSHFRPGWIEDAEQWASQEGWDVKKYRYFSFETEPNSSRQMACNLAKANARADIASEITTFIKKSLASSEQGQIALDPNNPSSEPIRSYVQNDLSERVQGLIHGSSIVKTYWEKRNYLVKLGAKKNYVGQTCAVLIRMDQDRLKEAINKAAQGIEKSATPELKQNVQKALENLEDEFLKARQGEI